MRAAFVIGLKDLRQRLRDRSAYIVGILAPLALVLILNATLGGANQDSFGFRFAVVDQDGGPVAASFLGVLDQIESERVALIDRVGSEEEAARLADVGDVSASFVIPAGFSAATQQGGSTMLRVIANPDAQIGTQVAQSIATGFAAEVNAVELSVAGVFVERGQPFDPQLAGGLAQEASTLANPATLATADAEGTGFDFTTYYAVGMGVFFLFFTVQFGILSLLEERYAGTMARLLAAPIRPASIILGKAIGAFAIGLASITIMVVATTALIGANWGAPLGVAMLAVAGVLAAMGIVALVATLARTPEQASGYASIAAVVLGLLGGAFFPVDLGPKLLSRVSQLTPHRWLLDGFRDLSAGESIARVLPAVGAVLIFATVTGGLGLLRARKLVRSA